MRTLARALLLATGFVAQSPPSMAASPLEHQASRTVLTIHWGSESDRATARLDAAIQRGLLANTGTSVNYFAEYLETEEFPAETASQALRDYIRRKYEGRQIDVVIAVASAALQFALQYREELFPGVPIVFLAVAVPEEVLERKVSGITGVVNDTPFSETLQLALRLHPSTKRVFVVAQAPSLVGYDERVRSALNGFSNRVELVYVHERTIAALFSRIKAIPPQSLILYTRYAPEEPTPTMDPDDVVRLMAPIAPVPVYAVSELYIGSGVVGGMIRGVDAAGYRLAAIARQILGGSRPEDLPIEAVQTSPVFDWRQVRRWRVEPSALPSESRILFRTPTVWETYGWYIAGAMTIVMVQLALIAGLVTQRERRRRAEGIVLAREASLRTSYERIRQLAGRLINAQETARASIAQDLHDDICQRLAMVSTSIDRLKDSSGDIQDDDTQQFLAAVGRDTRRTFEAVRRLSHDLHPATLRVLGLAPAIKTHCAELAKRHQVQVTFTAAGEFHHIPEDVAVCFFRIAQESLRNGIVHGAAQHLTVLLTGTGDNLDMTVTDDGRGFNLEAVTHDSSGVGIVSMEERARVIGATLQIITGVQHGTTIRISVSLSAPRPVSVPDVGGPAETIPAAVHSPSTS
jgi:signal transduction histidine kinase